MVERHRQNSLDMLGRARPGRANSANAPVSAQPAAEPSAPTRRGSRSASRTQRGLGSLYPAGTLA
jgi:hypothetical protein